LAEREFYRDVPNPEVCEVPGVCGDSEGTADKREVPNEDDLYKNYYTARARNHSPLNDPNKNGLKKP
jgi:hypothetical protein